MIDSVLNWLPVFVIVTVLSGAGLYSLFRPQIARYIEEDLSQRSLRILVVLGGLLSFTTPLSLSIHGFFPGLTSSPFLRSTLTLSAPLRHAAMGGLTSERCGVINIALEGKMLGAAIVTAIVATHTGNAALGLGAGIVAAIGLSLIHWLMTQTYRIDHVVSGMAINAIGFGLSNYLDRGFLDPDAAASIPVLPVNFYYVLAFGIPILLGLHLARTRGGLRLMAVGEDPEKARQMGVSPTGVRFWGLIATGVFCGLAGALVVSQTTRFVDGMTSGRGFIALAALILGGWRPIPALLACLGFGALQATQIHFQGTELMGAQIPTEIWLSIPYVATVIALAGFMGKRSRAPSGLGKA